MVVQWALKNDLYERDGGHGYFGLLIYQDSMYLTTFHDVNILHKSNIYKN